ncbi:MAG: deoxyguanosinetriphosphate triphosphohydrolase [Alphaproteobacteria bacterium]|nr:deoxyguanosinetriphosphate triphosphohydrolase [Alphaproteobacteria bacterium]
MASDRAPYASDPMASRGRLHGEPESETRTCFQRDRDRIIHSTALRRLMHKTQVFVSPEGDHFRTRLTHSLEVAQIARGLARSMSLDHDLAEALALAHDFGHPPFGHAGEEALDAAMKPFGGFDHNDQTLRVVVYLEQRYAAFDGLNLTWETLEGLVKHNGPLTGRKAKKKPLPRTIADYIGKHDLELDSFAGPEAQVAAIADDIAYDNHDVDDGLRAKLFTMETLAAAVPHIAEIYEAVARQYPRIEPGRLIQEVVRRQIDAMVNDVLAETRRRIREADPVSAAAVRALGQPVVAFSPAMVQKDRAIKSFLFENMYRHPSVTKETGAAREIVRDLFEGFMGAPGLLPEQWRRLTDGPGTLATARVAADYIAGMTDRYAERAHRHMKAGKAPAE